MKNTFLILISFFLIIILTDSLLCMIFDRGLFSHSSRKKYEYTDEYMALLGVNRYLISSSEETLPKGIKRFSEYTISKYKVVYVYLCNPNNNIVVITLPDCTNCMEDLIIGVALKKDFIKNYTENEKGKDITYPVLRIRRDSGVHVTVKSPDLIFPGDIYKDGKIISIYTIQERSRILKYLREVVLKNNLDE